MRTFALSLALDRDVLEDYALVIILPLLSSVLDTETERERDKEEERDETF